MVKQDRYKITINYIPDNKIEENLSALYDKILLFGLKPEKNNILYDQPKDNI